MIMQNEEPDSAIKSTVIFFLILNSTYSKSDLDEFASSSVHLYSSRHRKLLGIIKEFEGLFDRSLSKLDILPINL